MIDECTRSHVGDRGQLMAYRSALREQLDRPRDERSLDLAGAGHGAQQAKLLAGAVALAGLPGIEAVELGLGCQGYGFCQHYALSRLLGVRGQTPPVFFGRSGPLALERLLESVFREVEEPLAGDVAVYVEAGEVPHVALVRSVDGDRVTAESKFGFFPVVLRHELGAVLTEYGCRVAFHRLVEGAALRDVRAVLDSPLADEPGSVEG
ncbi:MAG: CHAP domain-containing protein [bacterium]|nr:CHAP domain-containing protein [bacterium]